jgi:hypothetical protein
MWSRPSTTIVSTMQAGGTAPAPELLDEIRRAIAPRHHGPSTEQAYVAWVGRFIVFNGKRHPIEMGEREV